MYHRTLCCIYTQYRTESWKLKSGRAMIMN